MKYSDMKPSMTTRIIAALVDGFVFFILYFLLFYLVGSPIILNSNDYKNSYKTFSEGLLSTGLYIQKDNQVTTISYEFDYDKKEKYDAAISSFYMNYSLEKEKEYQDSKKNYPTIFSYNEESLNYDFIDDKNVSTTYQTFFNEAISRAADYFLSQNKEVQKAYNKMYFYSNMTQILSITISLAIVYLLFPMIFKSGETLGKKLFKLRVVSIRNDKFELKKWQVLTRFLCLSIFEVIMSMFLYFIPLIISCIITFMTKNKQSVHDFIAQTMVLDKNKVEPILLEKTKEVSE